MHLWRKISKVILIESMNYEFMTNDKMKQIIILYNRNIYYGKGNFKRLKNFGIFTAKEFCKKLFCTKIYGGSTTNIFSFNCYEFPFSISFDLSTSVYRVRS